MGVSYGAGMMSPPKRLQKGNLQHIFFKGRFHEIVKLTQVENIAREAVFEPFLGCKLSESEFVKTFVPWFDHV